jgi:hypothetical protein
MGARFVEDDDRVGSYVDPDARDASGPGCSNVLSFANPTLEAPEVTLRPFRVPDDNALRMCGVIHPRRTGPGQLVDRQDAASGVVNHHPRIAFSC